MYNFNLILLLILIIFYIILIYFKIKETFKDNDLNIFPLKIFVNENNDKICNIEDKNNFKCGWDIIGTYPDNFPEFENIHKYNEPNIIIINKGRKGPKGLIGDQGNMINEDTKLKININKINDLNNKNLNINSDEINLKSDNKINLDEYSKICVDNNCFDNRILKNIYNYYNLIDDSIIKDNISPYTHPNDCTPLKKCYFKNIQTARMFKAKDQICDFDPNYNMIVCKPPL
jgi:hypothetical protein